MSYGVADEEWPGVHRETTAFIIYIKVVVFLLFLNGFLSAITQRWSLAKRGTDEETGRWRTHVKGGG